MDHRQTRMKRKLAPWLTALLCAIIVHIMIIAISANQHWLDVDVSASNFELFLLPASQQTTEESEQTTPYHNDNETYAAFEERDSEQSTAPFDIFDKQQQGGQANITESNLFEPNPLEQNTFGSQVQTQIQDENSNNLDNANGQEALFSSTVDNKTADTSELNDTFFSTDKPSLLDLSKISLSPNTDDDALEGVFSEELRNKIAESKKAQKDYLKGQIEEVTYPITKDSDGTRYVNIKGVCWRLPEPGSKEPWVIVFAGCSGQTKSFHFELNITPSTLLGPDSPFSIGH